MKKDVHTWLNEYGSSHQNRTNKLIHFVCVPVITFCLLGILFVITPWLLAAFVLFCAWFYLRLSVKLALGMLVMVAIMIGIILTLPYLLWICIGLFVLAWIFQFIGHAFEGVKPSFFTEILFLLIGPLWILSFLFKKMNLKF